MLRDGNWRWIGLLGALVAGVGACASSPSGEPAASPSSLVFELTVVGGASTESVGISNVAPSDPLTIESMGIAGADAAMFADQFDDDGSVVLAAGESVTVPVVYTPSAAGDHEATLRVNHSGAGDFGVPLSGTATAPDPGSAPLLAEPSTVAFPSTTVGQTASQDVVLRNGAVSGTVVVEATSIAGPDAAQFDDTFDDGDAVTLGPGGAVTVTVTFAPSASGPRQATLHVAHDGTNTPLAIPLQGQAAPAGGSTVLHRINAGGPALPGESGQPAWAEDSAGHPSPYANAEATGNQVSETTAPIDLTDPSLPPGTPAAVFQSERWDPPAAPNLTYALPVPEGTPVEVRLYFAEIAEQAQVVGGRMFDVKVEGTVVHRDLDVFARVGANRGLMLATPVVSDGTVDVGLVPGVQSPAIKAIEIVTTGDDVPPWLAAAPAYRDFPQAVARQTTTENVTITNVGSAGTLTLSGTTITGPAAKMFADRFDDTAPVVLAPGESTTIAVAFLPTSAGRHQANLELTHSGAAPLVVPLDGVAAPPSSANDPAFASEVLTGAGVTAPTSLQFGPDGRLYVAQMDGTIKALTVARNAAGQYSVTATETISLIRSLPNRNDNGTINGSVTGRLVTGLLVTGTAANPRIYAVSSDPRIGAGTSGTDLNLDTNSGILSRLTRQGGTWQKVDLVRGLPRSEENHSGNGLALDPATNTLLIGYGGHTNMGAPSHNFALLPEYALSAAVLSIDLDAIGGTTYNLPTLDDETRAGTNDANDPFGGNDGRNQARLVPGGPVQVYAAGFRNPFDLVLTDSGALYTIDNGGNAGWGGHPQPDDTTGTCSNDPVEGADTDRDSLIRITGAGFYGGHPNPTRANPANRFNPSNPQSPVATAAPEQCDYRTEAERGAMASFAFSTNGLDEYTATTFDGEMQGDLLAASLDGAVYRIRLSADGTAVASTSVMFSSAGLAPLDLTTRGDADPFPGTIWVADFAGDEITVFEPQNLVCSGADHPFLDEDDDGYDNADEIDNATNPCSAADVPSDADGDFTSDLNDPDDDNDGLPDGADPFAVDAANGRATPLPLVLTWDNDAPPAGGLLDLGFTGLMANGTNYGQLFDPTRMTAGGAAGVVTVDEASEGDALGALNSQEYGFQLGVDVDATTGPFVVHTRVPAPFTAGPPTGGEAFGVYVGSGDQDNYVKLAVAANDGAGGFQLVNEQAGTPTTITAGGVAWPGPGFVDLFLRVDPGAGTVLASYALDGGAPVVVGPAQPVPAAWFTGPTALAVGIISTSAGPAAPYPATWDFLEVLPAP